MPGGVKTSSTLPEGDWTPDVFRRKESADAPRPASQQVIRKSGSHVGAGMKSLHDRSLCVVDGA